MTTGWALLIDDNRGDLTLLEEAFAEAGLTAEHLRCAADAAGAWRVLEAHAAKPPCLVLCDSHLPGATGEEFYRALRADPRFADVPFILMTGMPDRGEPERDPPRWLKRASWSDLLDFVRRVHASFFDAYGACRAAG